jgi:alpha-galactosidase
LTSQLVLGDERKAMVSVLPRSLALALLVAGSLHILVHATNNGFPNALGRTPPRGWRSWNAFCMQINQTRILAQAAGLARRMHSIDGVPTSLLDLGYDTAGIDDGWSACGAGVNGSYHDSNGNPIIDLTRFPDMAGLVRTARTQYNVSMGWYMNCCGCEAEHKLSAPHYTQDTAMTAALGFAALKVDGCGNEPNITAWAEGLNRTGRAIVLENCNDNTPFRPEKLPDGTINCPYNFFRTSIDQAPSLTSTMWNLWQTVPFLSLGGPGCFPYPDMLTLGTPAWDPTCNQGQGCYPDAGCNHTRLDLEAAKAQFAAQALISSPLTLGFDLGNETEYSTWWPIVSNTEALSINAAWAGEAGRLAASSPTQWTGPVPHGALCEVFQVCTWAAGVSICACVCVCVRACVCVCACVRVCVYVCFHASDST